MTDVTRAPGGSLLYNRRNLANEMVTQVKGGFVQIRILANPDNPEEGYVKMRGGVDLRDHLRDAVYQLLTTVTYDVQDRFRLSRVNNGLGRGNALLPDDVIGCDLTDALRRSSQETPPSDSGDSA